jgi:SAM-dependent methyltransferase
LVTDFLGSKERVLEIGCGSNNLLDYLDSTLAVGCDLSIDVLRARVGNPGSEYVAAGGETLPFRDGQFDGLFLINVLEHVTDVEAVVDECARVLENEGICVAVTPNGNWEFWLDLAERWKLKLPEGPHAFLTFTKLRYHFQMSFDLVQHRTFLMLPAGPPAVAALIDKVSFCAFFKSGFLQLIVGKKRRRRE